MSSRLTQAFRIVVVVLIACAGVGCAESNFELASTSRLPKWFTQPAGADRADLTITMTYYVMPGGRTATFKLFNSSGRELRKVSGMQAGLEPLAFTPHVVGQPSPYPAYEVVTVDGVVDIVEHRQRGAVFHMTDDPVVWARFGPATGVHR
jgi:hypothetical protein